jgi:dephospho-CoA kinase
VRAGGETVGLRCPDHPLTLELLRAAEVPLAAPSANPSFLPSPKNAESVLEYFDGKIDAVIDGGECGLGRESTIIDMSSTPYRILREGALPEEQIWSALTDFMTIVGITGGTGCGKTTALTVLHEMGALVIDCDEVYHELTASSAEMKSELCARFGDIYCGNVLDRKRLGAIVFKDKAALRDLNAITHRYVDLEVARRLREHAKNGGRLAAIDAIALLETHLGEMTSFNVAVTAPEEERVRRLMLREGITEEYARLRISAQKSADYFRKNCGYVLENEGNMADFQNKCKKFFEEVLKNV